MAKIFEFLPPKLFIRVFVGLCLVAQVVRPELSPSQVATDKQPQLSLCELESFLRNIYNPNVEYELHTAVLRNKLKQLLENLHETDLANSYQRLEEISDPELEDVKRSIATLAKNGQLPSREPDTEATSMYWMRDSNKRNMASMARGGYLNSFQGKRNIGSLVRNGMLPTNLPKRSFSSLARSNSLPVTAFKSNYIKRNIGAMARDWALPNHQYHQTTKIADSPQDNDNKRDFNNSKKKRDLYSVSANDDLDDYNYNGMNSEIPEPYVQSSYNQDDLTNSGLYDFETKPEDEKRFLAPLIHGGWYYQQRTQPIISTTDNSEGDEEVEFKDKRHIGALAKTGWLPSYRSFRGGQFRRSGRGRPRIVEYFHPQDRHLQPIIAGACRRCDNLLTNTNGWTTDYQIQTGWGQPTPPRLTALHWRNFYGGSSYNNNRKL